jgi:Rab11 family-interacting protein 3/4
MEALKEQEEINFRLRQYMDKIILAILDHNPSILEIKHWVRVGCRAAVGPGT